MSKFISLFTDFGFKRVFGQEENKKFLIGFLNSLFEGELVVTDLHYRDKEQPPETKDGRGVIFDIHCTLADGRHLILEMQNKTNVNFAGRALYYIARRIVVQGMRGEWHYTLAPVFGVYFLNYKDATLGRSFRTDFCIGKKREFFVSESVRAEHEQLMAKGVNVPLADKLRMIFIQLPEFTKTASECENDFERWLYTMIHNKELDSIPWKDQNPIWSELAEVCSTAALTPEELFAYEEELRKQWDLDATMLAQFQAGEEKGRNEGRNDKAREIALALIQKGMDDGFIVDTTGLPIQDVQKLRAGNL